MPGGRWGILAFVAALLALNFWISSNALSPATRVKVPYNPTFLAEVRDGNVKEISSTGASIQGEFKSDVTYPARGEKDSVTSKEFSTEVPLFADSDQLDRLLQDNDVVINAKAPDDGPGLLVQILLGFGPVILIILLFVMLSRRMAGAGGGMMSFGRSRARRSEGGDTRVTFRDVAGIDEAENELHEIVDFLKSPQKYQRLGGKIPKGVLLSGQPGTGKTLLARAVAGEAGVPFFSISGSEFVEMFVGVGAARVRDLFEQARRAAPCIIFVDELDALGLSRMPGAFGGYDEKEQTLNQLLAELDGFDPSVGVILLAATNRPEILDPALLRAGRFDRQVLVDRPDQAGRLAILKVHIRKVRLAAGVPLDKVAGLTTGFTGADLANLVNEAAIAATRRHAEAVGFDDFTAAIERIVAGIEKKSRVLRPQERRRVAYHEMGHALVAAQLPGIDPVQKVSIIPRGVGALGYTMQRPTEDRFLLAVSELKNRIAVLMAGRAAEMLVFDGDVSTGAADDLQRATEIAVEMVTRYGMDAIVGQRVYAPRPQPFLNQSAQDLAVTAAEATAREIDLAVRNLVEEAGRRAVALLTEARRDLDSGAELLLARESLTAEEFAPLQAGGKQGESRELAPPAEAKAEVKQG